MKAREKTEGTSREKLPGGRDLNYAASHAFKSKGGGGLGGKRHERLTKGVSLGVRCHRGGIEKGNSDTLGRKRRTVDFIDLVQGGLCGKEPNAGGKTRERRRYKDSFIISREGP